MPVSSGKSKFPCMHCGGSVYWFVDFENTNIMSRISCVGCLLEYEEDKWRLWVAVTMIVRERLEHGNV